MTSKAKDAPRDLMALQYAAWLCENTLGIPANRSNMEVISQAIQSVSKARFRDKNKPIFTAFVWLDRQCEFAKVAKIPTNHLFFLNGDYNEVKEPEKKLNKFIPCQKCNDGWVYVEGSKDRRVTCCECRTRWVKESKEEK